MSNVINELDSKAMEKHRQQMDELFRTIEEKQEQKNGSRNSLQTNEQESDKLRNLNATLLSGNHIIKSFDHVITHFSAEWNEHIES